MKKFVIIFLVLLAALPAMSKDKKKDIVWEQYREISFPGISMEQIMTGVDAWDATSLYYTMRVDTADYEIGFINLDGVCDFEYNPKGYWCQGLPKGRVCHASVKMTVRDEVLKTLIPQHFSLTIFISS